ncbi:recombinase family protein [Nonomuraea sp. NPDC059007]|uniref:recombinase family protein n=1 Tax=Nonomuraea sp. NPDC059007 TaxID=3346692 RepID=UPI0036C8EE16
MLQGAGHAWDEPAGPTGFAGLVWSRCRCARLDTTTPGGHLVFHVFAALAEFIRDLIIAGTHEGLAAARAGGRVGGRPTVVDAELLKAARDLAGRSPRSPTARRQRGHPLQPHPRPPRTPHSPAAFST